MLNDLITEGRKRAVVVAMTMITGTVGVFQWFLPHAFGGLTVSGDSLPSLLRVFALAYGAVPLILLATFLSPRRTDFWRVASGSLVWLTAAYLASLLPSEEEWLRYLLVAGPPLILLFTLGGRVYRYWGALVARIFSQRGLLGIELRRFFRRPTRTRVVRWRSEKATMRMPAVAGLMAMGAATVYSTMALRTPFAVTRSVFGCGDAIARNAQAPASASAYCTFRSLNAQLTSADTAADSLQASRRWLNNSVVASVLRNASNSSPRVPEFVFAANNSGFLNELIDARRACDSLNWVASETLLGYAHKQIRTTPTTDSLSVKEPLAPCAVLQSEARTVFFAIQATLARAVDDRASSARSEWAFHLERMRELLRNTTLWVAALLLVALSLPIPYGVGDSEGKSRLGGALLVALVVLGPTLPKFLSRQVPIETPERLFYSRQFSLPSTLAAANKGSEGSEEEAGPDRGARRPMRIAVTPIPTVDSLMRARITPIEKSLIEVQRELANIR